MASPYHFLGIDCWRARYGGGHVEASEESEVDGQCSTFRVPDF